MFVLTAWRKNQDTRVIAVSSDKKLITDIQKSLNHAANEKTTGAFYVEEMPDMTAAEIYDAGIDFLNYRGKFRY